MTEVIKPTMMDYHRYILVCIGNKCTENGEGQNLYNELKIKLKAAGLDKGELRVKRNKVTCLEPVPRAPYFVYNLMVSGITISIVQS